MKKIILLVLVFLLMFSMTIPCFALENDEIQEMIAGEHLKPENVQVTQNETLSNGYVLFDYQIVGVDWSYTCEVDQYLMGDYVFSTGGDDNKRIYDGRKHYSIKNAYYRRIIDDALIEEIAALCPSQRVEKEDGQIWIKYGFTKIEDYPAEQLKYVNKFSYFLGDADMDGEITVMDATAIQKVKASLLSLESINRYAADYDADMHVTVIDATHIQKRLAGLE